MKNVIISHEELCDQALRDYESIAKEYHCRNTIIPQAIKFFKKYRPDYILDRNTYGDNVIEDSD